MPIYRVVDMIDGQPTFDKTLDVMLAEFKEALLSCKHGEAVEVNRKRRPKSQKQLGNVFGNMIAKIAEEANVTRQDGVDGLLKYVVDESQAKGCKASTDFIKELCYTIAPTHKGGRRLTLRSMDTKQAADFFKRVADIMGNYVYIPDPNKDWKKQ